MKSQPIDLSLIEQRLLRTADYANKNMEVIQHNEKKLFDALPLIMNGILQLNAKPVVKRNKLRNVAIEFNRSIEPYVACHHKCSHCCNIPVVITDYEAKMISEKTGIPYVQKPEGYIYPKEIINEASFEKFNLHNKTLYDRTPCTFLKDSECSIYDVRPMSCITHHSIDETPFFCDTTLPSEITSVPSINLHFLHQFNAAIDLNFYLCDIRAFFPKD